MKKHDVILLAGVLVLLVACGGQAELTPTETPPVEPTLAPTSTATEVPEEPTPEEVMEAVRLPAPTGAYAVGRKIFHLVDARRPELHTPDPDDPREFIVDIWYPAEVASVAQPGPYVSPGTAQSVGLTAALNESLPHAVVDAPVAGDDERFPVIIFNPGFAALHTEYTALVEELASHGYVVISISHPYVTGATVLPGGRLVPYLGEEQLDSLWAPTDKYVAELYLMWLPDTVYVLEQLPALDAETGGSLFAGRLDLTKIGFTGHSFGGETAVEICRIDDRCGAALSLDGGFTEDALSEPLNVPYMYIAADDKTTEGDVRNVLVFQQATNDAYLLKVQGSTHYSFGDGYYVGEAIAESPLALSRFGSVGSERMITIVRSYSVAFFDQYLRGNESDLLTGSADDFPDVEFEANYLED